MKRRYVLSVLGATLPLAGCSSPETVTPNDTSTDEPTPGTAESNATPNHAEGIFIVLQNETAERVTVAVTVATGNSVVFEGEATVAPDEIQHAYPEITERGEYEIRVSLPDRPGQTRPFDIEAYDRRMGSNINVWIADDGVRIGIEE